MKLLKKKVPSWMRPEIEWVVHEFLVMFASFIVSHSTAFHNAQTLRSLQGFQKKWIHFTIPTRWMKVQYFSLIMNMNNTHRFPLLRSYLSTLHSAWDTPCVCIWVISVSTLHSPTFSAGFRWTHWNPADFAGLQICHILSHGGSAGVRWSPVEKNKIKLTVVQRRGSAGVHRSPPDWNETGIRWNGN